MFAEMDHLKQLTDLEILVLLKNGDEPAFSELYRRYKEALFFHAMRMIDQPDEARDIVQNVFLAIWSKRETLVIPAAVDAYLYGSIRNRILNFIAHQQVVSKYARSIDTFLEKRVAFTDEPLLEKELTGIIDREISLLPEKMRIVFELSRQGELSYAQIAEKLNISEHTVKKQAQRAIKILRFKIKLNIFFSFLSC